MVDFCLKTGGVKALGQHGAAGQLVNHAGVGLQVARGPARRAQHAQQALVHLWALVEQRQIALAAQQRLHPVDQAPASQFGGAALTQPLGAALHQFEQAGARFVAQRQHARVGAPVGQALLEGAVQHVQGGVQVQRYRTGFALDVAAIARRRRAAQQRVKLVRHQLAVCVKLGQKRAGVCATQGLGDPGQVAVGRGQHMGLLVVQVLDAVLGLAQKNIGLGQSAGGGLGHEAGLGQARQGADGGAGAQLRKLAAAHHLQ